MKTRLHTRLRFAPALVDVDRRADGSCLLRSPQKLRAHSRAVGEWIERWAAEIPERVYLGERLDDGWRTLTYRQALDAVRRIGQSLLDAGLGAERPVAILSENSVDHALLALGAMHVGVPAAPISPAYSLLSRDFVKLKTIFALLRPGLVYASDGARFAAALGALPREDATVVLGTHAGAVARAVPFSRLLDNPAGTRVDQAFAGIGPDTVAKILFTSGSTGEPKGVINTQRMLCANQQMIAQTWPFLEDTPPVLVDWQPWNHTAGGNFCFNVALRNGGSFYVDGGRPLPGLIETTARNLKEVSPTLYSNVPRGFDLLLPFLESDAELRRSFFKHLEIVLYAGAALPQNLWERIENLAIAERGGELAIAAGWGSTETAPTATLTVGPGEQAGNIGLPIAACELKLVPSGGKLEVRVRGPNVTPGYLRREDLTRAAFDDERFYRIGDAMKFADASNPVKGLLFDGRVVEDFKLVTGTWVHVGAVRMRLIAACDPLVQDAVITGHDRGEVGALLFLNPLTAKRFCRAAPQDASLAWFAANQDVRTKIAEGLAKLAQETAASSMHPTRALVMTEPPSPDAGEITDKGYLNQRAVLERRAAFVETLYARPLVPEVILVR